MIVILEILVDIEVANMEEAVHEAENICKSVGEISNIITAVNLNDYWEEGKENER